MFIELLTKKYLDFKDEDLDEKSFFIFLEKVIEYSPNKKVELLQSLLPKFRQNYNIYLKLFNNLGKEKIVRYENLLNKEKTNNIQLLIELMKNK